MQAVRERTDFLIANLFDDRGQLIQLIAQLSGTERPGSLGELREAYLGGDEPALHGAMQRVGQIAPQVLVRQREQAPATIELLHLAFELLLAGAGAVREPANHPSDRHT